MKFTINRADPRQRIAIPRAAQKISGLNEEIALEVNTLGCSIVINKAEMTAMEMIHLIDSLSIFATDMILKLREICGVCDSCGCCALIDIHDENIHLPDYVLEEAGLPPYCKLTANVDDAGTITVSQAGYDFDLSDVPPELLEVFQKTGICSRELDELLMADGVVNSEDVEDDEHF